MENVVTKQARCSDCELPFVANCLRNGRCSSCERERPRAELVMRQWLIQKFPDCCWTFNKTNLGISACSDRRYRPDCFLELPNLNFVVECDERQHSDYNEQCEIKRLVELLAAGEGTPLKVVRWNPDKFRIKGKSKKVPMEKRLAALQQAVHAAFAEPCDTLLSVQYLFYDDLREQQLQKRLTAEMSPYMNAGVELFSQG